MSKKNAHIFLTIAGVIIMLIAFPIIPESKPWYYKVLLFDVGFVLSMIPQFPKLKRRFLKNKAKV